MNPSHVAKALRGCGLAGAVTLAMAVGPVSAQLASAPRVLQSPTGDDMARYYPDRAQRLEVQGRAGIACGVDPAGLLTACTVTHEWPKGYGFGEAALQLSRSFRITGTQAFHTMISFNLACDDGIRVSPHGRLEDSRMLQVLSCPSRRDEDAVFPGGDVPLSVTLHCWLTAEGRLDGCAGDGPDTVASAAAARLAPLWRTAPPGPAYVHGVATVQMTLTPPDPGPAADVAGPPR